MTDWAIVKEGLQSATWPSVSRITKTQIDSCIARTEQIFAVCLESGSRKVRRKNRREFKVSEETQSWIYLRRKLVKSRKDAVDAFAKDYIRRIGNRCNKMVRKSLQKDEKIAENQFAEKIAKEKDTAKRWRLLNKFKNKLEETPPNTGLYNDAGEFKIDEQSVADIHASRLEKTHSEPIHPSFDQR